EGRGGGTWRLRLSSESPQMPQRRLVGLRSTEKGRARSQEVLAQVEAMNPQPIVGVIGKNEAQHQEKEHAKGRRYQAEKGFAFKDQAPVQRLFPTGVHRIQ